MKWCNNRGADETTIVNDRRKGGQEIIRHPRPAPLPEIGNIDKIFSLLFTILVER